MPSDSPTVWPAIWSAAAATFSALTAFFVLRIQRQNLLDAARPELVVTGWERSPHEAGSEVIRVKKVKNIGRGVALYVRAYVDTPLGEDARPHVASGMAIIPILGPNEEAELGSEILVWWKNIEPRGGSRFVHVPFLVRCWDTKNFLHKTTYTVTATDPPAAMFGAAELGPGLSLTTRATRATPAWRVRLTGRRNRVVMWVKASSTAFGSPRIGIAGATRLARRLVPLRSGDRIVTAPPPRRPWWRRKRTWATLAVLFVLAYPASVGPFDYAANRGWLPPTIHAAGGPLYAPYRWLLSALPPSWSERLDGYGGWWRQLAFRHKTAASD